MVFNVVPIKASLTRTTLMKAYRYTELYQDACILALHTLEENALLQNFVEGVVCRNLIFKLILYIYEESQMEKQSAGKI